MNYEIREIKESEYHLLKDFLFEAIFIPEGVEPPERTILNEPELQLYIKDFGKFKSDMCLVAEIEGKIVGAVWGRIIEDYGHIDDDTPSLAISLYKDYRGFGFGIGTELMRKMLIMLKNAGYKKASLSVQKANYAVNMYKNVGFEKYDENKEEYIMVCTL